MQSVRDNEIAASTCGIDVFRTKVLAFAISAVLGGPGRRAVCRGAGLHQP